MERKNRNLILVIVLTVLVIFLIYFLQNNVTGNVVLSSDYSKNFLNEDSIFLEANEGDYEFHEGIKTKVFTYNGQMPGPLIEGYVAENKTVLVKNNLDFPTTVHWHGLQLANVADGVPEVTQEPIMPGESFEYVLEFRNPGLYWYHSHVDSKRQVESGLQGAILVKEKGEGESNVLVLDDVLLDSNSQFEDFDIGVMHGRFGNNILVNGKINPKIDLVNNRLRIVNTANARSFTISFSGEEFEVIGRDIGPSERFKTRSLTIHPGERYDLLLLGDSKEEISLLAYIRGPREIARLNYNSEVAEVGDYEFSLPFNLEEVLEKEADYNVSLRGFVEGGELVWAINGKYFDKNPEVFDLNEREIVKFRIVNTQGQPHPMHLHGQKFVVLSRNGVLEENFGYKDTVMVNGGETVEIAFFAEEKGTWVFHCHILEHADAGMLSLVRVR